MKKYLTLFGLSWQKQLEVRSDFLFERARSLSILISLYFLWSALLANRTDILGYSREQLLTYVFMMTFLRALVLGAVTDRIPMEIAQGRLSDVLLRPLSHLAYWGTQDAANKCLNLVSAVLEVSVFALLVGAPFFVPRDPATWAAFALATVGGMVLYFQMSYLLGVIGFWTAQSWGPRFCFEIVLEFAAGAYFPIDLLPEAAQRFLSWLPFPYLIFYPVSIYLERVPASDALMVFARQALWIVILTVAVRWLWGRGLRRYAAEGR